MLQEGMQVMLVDLKSSPDLNFAQGVLGIYLHDSQRWVVELPCGRQVKVRQANLQTLDVAAQDYYTLFGYPDDNTPALADIVEERMGKQGRYLVAKQPIAARTFARDIKLRMSMKADKNEQLVIRLIANITELLGPAFKFDVQPVNFNVTASYVEEFMRKWLLENDVGPENDLLRHLMDYDHYSPTILQEMMERMHAEDLFWFDFWCTEMPDVPADTIWRVQTFLMSHAFLQDRTMVVGLSSLAGCTEIRWKWLLAMRRGEPQPRLDIVSAAGNFQEMPPPLVQAQQGRGKIPANECILFHTDIKKGEPLLCDYEDNYFLSRDKQLCRDCPPALLPFLFRIVSRLDPRVTEALEAHMRGTQ